jgi:hypothetical protein
MNRRSLVSLKLKNGLTDLNIYFFLLLALIQGWFKKKKNWKSCRDDISLTVHRQNRMVPTPNSRHITHFQHFDFSSENMYFVCTFPIVFTSSQKNLGIEIWTRQRLSGQLVIYK